MALTNRERKYIANAPTFREHLLQQLQDPEFQKGWMEITLQEFLEDGNVDEFIRSMTKVVQARGRGEITRLAKELNMDRSNLSEIINGKTKPQLGTILKLINGLGYDCEIKLKKTKRKKKLA